MHPQTPVPQYYSGIDVEHQQQTYQMVLSQHDVVPHPLRVTTALTCDVHSVRIWLHPWVQLHSDGLRKVAAVPGP